MSFQSPLFLLALLAVPLLLGFALWVDRRRAKFPVAYTNIDVLASVIEHKRSASRWVPLVLLLLALAFAAGASRARRRT